MPDWLIPLICFVGLVAFIGFAFRQGTKVKPDRNNTDNWQTTDTSLIEGSHHGSDGHS